MSRLLFLHHRQQLTGEQEMTTYSITEIVAAAKLANNGRLLTSAMTGPQIRAAEKAVARGLMTKHAMPFPGYGPFFIFAYQIAA